MKLEDQVTSIELSKRLKELGVKQESIFVWEWFNDTFYGVKYFPFVVVPSQFNGYKTYSAFTVAELIEMLPAWIDTKLDEEFNNLYLEIIKRKTLYIQYIARYICYSIPSEEIDNPYFKVLSTLKSYDEKLVELKFYDEKLADCLAKMLICLLENKLLELNDE